MPDISKPCDIVVYLEGGLVSAVGINGPSATTSVMVVDFDLEGAEACDIIGWNDDRAVCHYPLKFDLTQEDLAASKKAAEHLEKRRLEEMDVILASEKEAIDKLRARGWAIALIAPSHLESSDNKAERIEDIMRDRGFDAL